MERHHIVQDKYLKQWLASESETELNIYVIPNNEIIRRGTGWKGFWRKDFNILDEEDNEYYLPEKITAHIDSLGIKVIRAIDPTRRVQLNGEDRSALGFYIALQYLRTPRHREETDKLVNKALNLLVKQDISSPEKVGLIKEDLLKEVPKNDLEKEMLERVKSMTNDEIQKIVFEAIQSEDVAASLSKTGHSKNLLKVDRIAKEIFNFQWVFLVAPKNTSFVTSDNPCFTISKGKFGNGICSPTAITIFPLRPDLCVFVKPSIPSQREEYMELPTREVRNLNKTIILNSYDCVVAREKTHLISLIKGFDHTKHRKSRDIELYEEGSYIMFNVE